MGQPQSLAHKSYELITDAPSPATRSGFGANPYRVLVAADDARARSSLVSALVPCGFDVLAFSEGRGVLEFLSMTMKRNVDVEPPDLIVADLDLPGAGGLEVVAALRELDWSTPVVLLTAFPDEALEEESARMGVTAVFAKPVDLTELRSLARELLPAA